MLEINNFINNAWQPPYSGQYLEGINPATESVFYQLANSTQQDLDVAIASCESAKQNWQQASIEMRANCLSNLAQLIEENIEELATLESQDTGKPISVARTVDIPRSAKNFHFFAQALSQFSSHCYANHGTDINYTLNQPLGIVGCISPWNLPLYLFSWKIAPALAAGNCVIAKPSELTPLTANKLAELVIKAGFPPGVLNILHGEGKEIGHLICTHPKVKAISFTGGTITGQHIAKSTAQDLKKLSLELGGKNASVIFDDYNFDLVIKEVIRSGFSNQGEICLCTSRIFIQDTIYEKVKFALQKQIGQLIKGDPSDPHTQFGALISKKHLDKVSSWVKQAISDGGHIITGGHSYKINDKGYYFEPTLIEALDNQAEINQHEVFGPVSCLMPFKDEQDAIKKVNDSKYGLAASIWTNDLKRAHRLAHDIETGIVWVNTWMQRDLRTPFGGTKQSGLGREGGFNAIEFFTEKKNICIHLGE